MNGSGKDRYSSNWEKLSKKLRLLFPCCLCGENDFKQKECHHIDFDKRNSTVENALVVCVACHRAIHDGVQSVPNPLPEYSKAFNIQSFKVASQPSTVKNWFDKDKPLKLINNLPSKIANDFRKQNIKAFVNIGSCNLYIGLENNGLLIGVLGFQNPEHGNYDIFLKADTTPAEWDYSTDLILYALRTKQVKDILEHKFNRTVNTAYSMCFSKHHQINRYRKHGKMTNKVETDGGYNLGYTFNLGEIPSLKAAKSMWMQKHL